MRIIASKRIVAADEDESFMDESFDDAFDAPAGDGDEDVDDKLDSIADDIDEMQDDLDDVKEDGVDIEIDNNIENHYIAECDQCHGVFISAVIETAQEVESVTGTCPICNQNSTQYLKWVVKPIEHDEDEVEEEGMIGFE